MTDDTLARIKALNQRIYELKVRRDAQDPAGALFLHIQREIEHVTHDLLLLEHHSPELARLDIAITEADRRLDMARETYDPWRTGAGVAAVVGAPLLLLGLWLPATPFVLCGAVFLIAALAFELVSTRRHRQYVEAVDTYQDDLADLVAKRAALLDRPQVPGLVPPVRAVVLDAGTPEITDGSTGGTR